MTDCILSSSVLILVIVLLRRLLRGRVSLRLQYALWGLVLLRLLIPVSLFSSPMSVMNAVEGARMSRQTEAVMPSGTETSALPVSPAGDERPVPAAEAPEGTAIGQTPPEKSFDTAALTDLLPAILKAVWLTGAAALAVVLIFSNLRFGAVLRRNRVRMEADCPLSVYLTGKVETPCLFGVLSPTVYITSQAAADERTLRHVLAHEYTHYRHRDQLWSALRCVCLVLHWYNPLVWLAAVLSRRDGELACDEGTIRLLGEDSRADYGRTLIGLTLARERAGDMLLCATTMVGSRGSIKERIMLIAQKPRTAAYTLAAVILAAAVAVGCTFTGARDTEQPRSLIDRTLVPDSVSIVEPLSSAVSPGPLTDPETVARLYEAYCKMEPGEETELTRDGVWSYWITFGESGSGRSASFILHRNGIVSFFDQEGQLSYYELEDGEELYQLYQSCFSAMTERREEAEGEEIAYDPGQVFDLVSAELWTGERSIAVNDAAALDYLESALGSAYELGSATSCGFGCTLRLTRADGRSVVCELATDSCAAVRAGDRYYAYGSGNEELFALFCPELIHDMSQNAFDRELMGYIHWGRYDNAYGAEETLALMDQVWDFLREAEGGDEWGDRLQAAMGWTRGLDGAYAEYYAVILNKAYELDKAEFAWRCLGNLPDWQGTEIIGFLAYVRGVEIESMRAELESALPQS